MNKPSKILALSIIAAGTAIIIKILIKRRRTKVNQLDKRNWPLTNGNKSETATINADTQRDTQEDTTQRMYKDLGMTSEQQKRYETDFQAVVSGWEKDNPKVPMDDTTRTQQQQKTLNAVLDEAQYAMYRDWSIGNSN
ncbi:MAG: hypothetical protein WA775_14830 [Psychroserpens sp.]|uniref:hypothetical protein n=1 Tax=Psychroserpens sp. TaxID=2020870 RepID=UPI003C72A929